MKILKLLVSVKSIIAFIGITFSTHAYSQEKGFEPAAVFENWGFLWGTIQNSVGLCQNPKIQRILEMVELLRLKEEPSFYL